MKDIYLKLGHCWFVKLSFRFDFFFFLKFVGDIFTTWVIEIANWNGKRPALKPDGLSFFCLDFCVDLHFKNTRLYSFNCDCSW